MAVDKARVGFIGLGIMGTAMTLRLLEKGWPVTVWNLEAERVPPLVSAGATAATSPREVALASDIVVMCVLHTEAVLHCVFGVNGIAAAAGPGKILIDHSPIDPAATREMAQQLRSQSGMRWVDAPVSGGVEGAQKGTLAIMTGGDSTAFEAARPILAAMGKTIEHFGPAGSGQATKATNQIMCAGIIRACAEAMAFAGAHQLPLDRVVSTLGAGAGSSWYFVHRAPNMIRESYPAGFRVKLHAKDLAICRDMAARFGVSLPVVDSMLAEYAELIARGFGDEDISATHRLKQALFKGAARKP